VGNQGLILHYDGSGWKEVTSPANRTLYGIAFRTPSEGWAVGEKGTILKYDGTSWTKSDSPVERTFLNVAFFNGKDGYLVGRSGELLTLRDGKWVPSNGSLTRKTLFAIDIPQDGKPWIVATTRGIFKKQL